ncbi:siphovirus ReqiPepy6 Gp37-like family protein [Streptomyces sp. NPDC005955]|uniref:siphovirus ReqiPepy6 Gp37-like family protein n=1 Tax=Streptomyces sp. NPDC005955 TaxID=3364738 RepID=UPI0036BB4B1A
MTLGYRVEVFNKSLQRIGEIDEWISLDFTVRLCQEGSWQILIKDGTTQSRLIEKGGGIAIWQDGVPKPVLSGQVETFQKYWTKVQHTGPGSVFIAGKCHNTLAHRRLAFPDPTRPVSEQYLSRLPHRIVRAPYPAAAIWDELSHALGQSALPDRRISAVSMPEPLPPTNPKAFGDTVRFDSVGSKLEEWYAKRGMAHRFIYNPNSQKIDLETFSPRDRSKEVRFSPDLGNLREYIWTLTAPKSTRAIVGCAGENADRYYHQQVNSEAEAEWGRQIETFVDRRDIQLKTDRTTGRPVKADDSMTTDDVAAAEWALEEAASEVLSEGGGNGNFQVYPIDTADCTFGKHYFVGDKVTIAVDGTEYSDIVREVVISVDDGGNVQDVSPKIGQQGSGDPLNLYKTVYDMQRKLRRLESRM